MERQESELKFVVNPKNPLPTVEVDSDSIPTDLNGYDLASKALSLFASTFPEDLATIYVYEGMSRNFHKPTWSYFFGVTGDIRLLDVLIHDFKKAGVTNVRASDYIDQSVATCSIHVQDGHVWRRLDAVTWYAETIENTVISDDLAIETEQPEAAPDATVRTAPQP